MVRGKQACCARRVSFLARSAAEISVAHVLRAPFPPYKGSGAYTGSTTCRHVAPRPSNRWFGLPIEPGGSACPMLKGCPTASGVVTTYGSPAIRRAAQNHRRVGSSRVDNSASPIRSGNSEALGPATVIQTGRCHAGAVWITVAGSREREWDLSFPNPIHPFCLWRHSCRL